MVEQCGDKWWVTRIGEEEDRHALAFSSRRTCRGNSFIMA